MTKKILVTGGAGFIGSHLVEKLLSLGFEVLCLDNFFTGSNQNIKHLQTNPAFHLISHDINNPYHFDVDEIFNLGCPASPIHYQKDPVFTIKTNFFGTLHALELARKKNIKIFQASTSEVYGDPISHPQREDYWGHVNPIGIRACYDEGKRIAETLCFDYWRQHKVFIKVGRIFNTYGPKMHPKDGRVVSNFIVQALKGNDITIYGQGLQTRSFCYVDDLIEAILRMMTTATSVTGPINLGNPNEFTILDLAKIVIELTGSSSKIVFKPLPLDDPRQRCPDISLARKHLGWQPTVSLKDGLIKTIEYFEEILEDPKLSTYL